MEINPKLLQPIPFYMSYPGYFGPGKEKQMLQDMEYLQQMYPDRLSLLHLADSMRRTLEQEGLEPSEDVVQLLLLNEVYKRRHGGRRGRIF